MRSAVPACLLFAGCQIYPSYYPAEVAPFREDDTDTPPPPHTGLPTPTPTPTPTGGTGSTGDTGATTTDPTVTTPGGAVVVTYPTGVATGSLPCDTADPYVVSWVTFDNPAGRSLEVWARADDCTETLAYATTELLVQVALPSAGGYVVRAGGYTWASFVLPAQGVYLQVEIP